MQPEEIVIHGGLPDANPFDRAGAALSWHRQPGESEEAFRARVLAEAEAAGAEHVVFGGLPTAQ